MGQESILGISERSVRSMRAAVEAGLRNEGSIMEGGMCYAIATRTARMSSMPFQENPLCSQGYEE